MQDNNATPTVYTPEQLYYALANAETGRVTDDNPLTADGRFIRTRYQPAAGSTAYGPVQITGSTMADFANRYPERFADHADYISRFDTQRQNFNRYGGEPNREGYHARYDYGGAGDLATEADRAAYQQVAQQMIAQMYENQDQDLDDFIQRWRGVPENQDRRYYREVRHALQNYQAPTAVAPAEAPAPAGNNAFLNLLRGYMPAQATTRAVPQLPAKPKPLYPQQHTIRAGDNLSAISRQYYGNAGHYNHIAASNNISDPNRIQVGQELSIPAPPGATSNMKPKSLSQVSKFQKVSRAAKGIPSRDDYGDLDKLVPGLYDYFLQHHVAKRAGPHYDLRIGDKEQGLHSWAVPKGMPKDKKHLAIHQPLHSHEYGRFAGTIPKGYGAGSVHKADEGKVLITKISPGAIHFTTAHRKHPERFSLIKTKGKNWLLINSTPKDAVPYKKIRYKKIPKDQIEPVLENLNKGDTVQAKIDGASSLIKVLKDGVELVSYRPQKETNQPIVHTERFFGTKPNKEMPKDLVGSVLKGELYGQDPEGKVIHPSALGGLLNATIENSLEKQKGSGIELKNMLFDIQRKGNEDIDFNTVPYKERRELLGEVAEHLPNPEKFQLSELLEGDKATELWDQISSGNHPLTREGVVIHPEKGKPSKAKVVDDADVHITGTFPGKGKRKDTIGGLTYALTAGGDTIGRIGTGFDDETLKHLSQIDLVDRIARIQAQEQLPSGAYRTPSFIALHEDK